MSWRVGNHIPPTGRWRWSKIPCPSPLITTNDTKRKDDKLLKPESINENIVCSCITIHWGVLVNNTTSLSSTIISYCVVSSPKTEGVLKAIVFQTFTVWRCEKHAEYMNQSNFVNLDVCCTQLVCKSWACHQHRRAPLSIKDRMKRNAHPSVNVCDVSESDSSRQRVIGQVLNASDAVVLGVQSDSIDGRQKIAIAMALLLQKSEGYLFKRKLVLLF